MIELLRKRRSMRAFTEQPVDAGTVETLVESLLRAPTSRGINPWEFVVVDDRELIGQLATAKQHGSSFLKGAPLAVVICADSTKSDVWIEDCSIAAILLQMTAQSLGLGSCWIQIRKRQRDKETTSEAYIQELLGIPDHVKVECMIAIGYPAQNRQPVPADALHYDKVRHNGYAPRWDR
ncbi:nitroreductase family protein [Geomonas sp. Red32]|uniref:nitroreductase family protein n=1 Tax=Geomonas sp. Red32 TaxID=2912856 RepID=UPI00202D0471|nr:nitroreductase family protein [Geomonas sp. Red32]MCM0082476.1 nitroreductase family protein [Geomonas sp. Red32]